MLGTGRRRGDQRQHQRQEEREQHPHLVPDRASNGGAHGVVGDAHGVTPEKEKRYRAIGRMENVVAAADVGNACGLNPSSYNDSISTRREPPAVRMVRSFPSLM